MPIKAFREILETPLPVFAFGAQARDGAGRLDLFSKCCSTLADKLASLPGGGPVTPQTLPEASGFRPWPFTMLLAAICLLTLALLIERSAHLFDPDRWFLRQSASYSVSIGGNVLNVPSELIKAPGFELLRYKDLGSVKKLQLVMTYPDLRPLPEDARAFSDQSLPKNAILVDLEHNPGREALQGHLETFYKRLSRGEKRGPNGLKLLSMSARQSVQTDLIAYNPDTPNGFIARCLTTPTKGQSICYRALVLRSGLELRYRFDSKLLEDWQNLDRSIIARVNAFSTGQGLEKTKGPSAARGS